MILLACTWWFDALYAVALAGSGWVLLRDWRQRRAPRGA